MAEVTTTFEADGSQFEAVVKRLIKEMRRFATVAENSISQLDPSFKRATAASAKLEAQQKKTNAELAKAKSVEAAAKPQRATGPVLGPNIPLDAKAIGRINTALSTSRREAELIRKEEQQRALATLRTSASITAQNSQLRTTRQLSEDVAKASAETGDEIKELAQKDMPSLRYALYDVSNSFRRISVAALAIVAAPVGFAISYERQFANVQRTNELAESSIDGVRQSLLDIARSTPISWEDITNIAALAGQLGIAEESLAAFTETTAKIAATTNLSVDAAATALGRLDQLISGVDGRFENLGSAILAVGVDSVATESQIVGVATNIASIANLANISAAEVVGLSGAIASLGIRPELARGTVTRLFSQINRSIAEGGTALEEFARLTGRTGDEFSRAWESDATNVLLDFFQGIQDEGSRAERTLRDIGITSVRDIPAILRLAQSQDEVRRLVALSTDEFLLGTKVNEQYGIIADTLSAQLERLGQNFQILAAEVGNLELIFAPAIGSLNSLLESISRFAATDVGKAFSGLTIGVALFIAALTGLGAIIASTIAGVIGLQFAARVAGFDLSALTFRSILSGKAFFDFAASVGGAQGALARFGVVARASLGIFGLLLGVLSAVALAYDYSQERARKAAQVQEQLIGDTSNLTDALIEDGKAAESGQEVYRQWTSGLEDNTDARRDNLNAAKENLGITGQEEGAIDGVTTSIKEQTLAIGENVKERLRNQAIEVPAFQQLFGDETLFQQLQGLVGQDVFGGIFEQIAQGAGDELYNQIETALTDAVTAAEVALQQAQISGVVGAELEVYRDNVIGAAEDLKLFKDEGRAAFDAIEGGLGQLETSGTLLERFGIAAEDSADGINLADQALRDISNQIFNAENEMRNINDTAQDFGKAIYDLGDGLSITDDSVQDFINSILLADSATLTADEKMALLAQTITILNANGIVAGPIIDALNAAILGLGTSSGLVNPELGNTADQIARIVGAVSITLGDGLSKGLQGIERSAGGAASKVKTLNEQFDEFIGKIFEPVKAAQSAAKSIAALGESYAELGENAFYASGEIQSAVNDILDASSTPEEAVSNLNSLFNTLARTVGSDTAPSLQFLRSVIDRVAAEFGVASNAISQATLDLSFFEDGIQSAQKEVRTLLDYAGDIDDVISRAFDIRFADILQIDKIAEAWQDLSEQVEDAKIAIDELKQSQQDLAADRAIKQYFLSVAESYGDMLRAAQLRQELAEIDRQQQQNAAELANAQAAAGGDLSGDGEASRQNRGALLDLIREYQDYITTLAETGASKKELKQATAEARAEFIQQALELGYQEEVVLDYARAFDDVTTAIDKVPRNITVSANVNPALQALAELNAKLKDNINTAARLNKVLSDRSQINPNIPRSEPTPNWSVTSTATSRPVSATTGRQYGASIFDNYASGGYTGPGGKYQPAGIVHKGEYVVPKQYVNQSSGLPNAQFLAQLQNGMRGYAMGGFVGGSGMGSDVMMVELSPYDRKLLADAGNVQLRVNGRVLAETTNASNYNQARRGSN